jgi:hypothetical protein
MPAQPDPGAVHQWRALAMSGLEDHQIRQAIYRDFWRHVAFGPDWNDREKAERRYMFQRFGHEDPTTAWMEKFYPEEEDGAPSADDLRFAEFRQKLDALLEEYRIEIPDYQKPRRTQMTDAH